MWVNLDRATFLLVLGDALGEHTFNDRPDGQVLLPGDSPDLCNEAFVTDAREVPCVVCGHIFGAAIGLSSSPTFADSLLRCI